MGPLGAGSTAFCQPTLQAPACHTGLLSPLSRPTASICAAPEAANAVSAFSGFAGFSAPCGIQADAQRRPNDGRLAAVLHTLVARCSPVLAAAQVWQSLLGPNLESLAQQESPERALQPVFQMPCSADPTLATFLDSSRERGIVGAELGGLARVWSKGVLQVVQSLSNLNDTAHPLTKFAGGTSAVGEVVYIPVYEMYSPLPRVVAMLEVLVAARVQESMVVANLISLASDLLSQVQFSISLPQPLAYHAPQLQLLPAASISESTEEPSVSTGATPAKMLVYSACRAGSAGSTDSVGAGSARSGMSRTSSMTRNESKRELRSFGSR